MDPNKKLSRRDILKLGASATAGLALAACVGTPAATTTAPAVTTAPPGAETINFRSSIWGDVSDKTTWTNIANDFMAANPKIKVTLEQYIEAEGTGSYYDRVKVGLASGTAPDALYMQGFSWQPYAMTKSLRPIDDLVTKDNFTKPFPDIDNYKWNSAWHNVKYLVPAHSGSVIMFYNKDIFDLFGVPYPKEGWTYEEFKDTAIKLSGTKNGTQYYGFANAGGWAGIYGRALHWIRKDGNLEWDTLSEPHKAQFIQDDIIEALQWTICDATTNKWTPAPAALAGGGLSISSGQVAMTYEGPWYLPNMWGPQAQKKGGVNFEVIHMPYGKAGQDKSVSVFGV